MTWLSVIPAWAVVLLAVLGQVLLTLAVSIVRDLLARRRVERGLEERWRRLFAQGLTSQRYDEWRRGQS